MKLLDLSEIKEGLDELFMPLKAEMDMYGYRLLPSYLKAQDIIDFEALVLMDLPGDFSQWLLAYDFSDLSICNVQFGCNHQLSYLQHLIDLNEGNCYKVHHKLVIAITDPYTFFLDLSNGMISALTSDMNIDDAQVIAQNFNQFMIALGNVFLLRKTENHKDLLAEINQLTNTQDQEFWSTMV